MSSVGKNKAIFSYKNMDRKGSNFTYKDFEKTKSFNTDFSAVKFIGTSFRAAQLKYCNFSRCEFSGTDFVGTNLRGSKFFDTIFNDCIFVATNFDKTNFKGAIFCNCSFIGTNLKLSNNLPYLHNQNIVLSSAPTQNTIGDELKDIIELLRNNDYIRLSHTLHSKEGRVNTLSIMLLRKYYSDDQLIKYLPMIPQFVTKQFYTFSYLRMLLKKTEKSCIL